MNESDAVARRKRVRLSPDVRSRQIIDAALVEFSRHGFAATRIEDIARRAGLSKSGIYAHYASKDEIFDALLTAVLTPRESGNGWLPDADMPLSAMVESYVDELYGRLRDPDVVATFRLVVAESDRVPALIRRWHAQVIQGHRAWEQAIVDASVRRGVMRKSALTDHFSLAVAPAVLWLLTYTVFKDDSPMPLAQAREVHKQLLLDILRPG